MGRITRPKPRTIVLLVVIGCVFLAGCSGLGGDGSPEEDNETTGAEEVNNTTADPAGANDTTNASEGTNETADDRADQPDTGDGGEANESEPDVDASPTPEDDSGTDESSGTDENTTDSDETDETNESDEGDGTDGTEDATGTDGTEEPNDSTETDPPTDEGEDATQSDGSEDVMDTDEVDESDSTDGTDTSDDTDESDASSSTDGTDESDATGDSDGTESSDDSETTNETAEPDETGESDETSETDESDSTDDSADPDTDDSDDSETTAEPAESDDSDDSDTTDETDDSSSTDGTGETEEYASPEEIRIDEVTHMESDTGLDRDRITVTNTNDELALPVGGWEVAIEGTDQRVTIEEGTVLEPGETRTIPLGNGEKVLNPDGGVAHLYDADGNHVGSWDHVGSPSDPPDASSDPAEVNTGDEEGHLQFEIVDAESGEGIEGAEVAVENGETVLTGTTDGAGVATIREIPYGEYELTVEHEQYANHSETVTIDEAGAEMTLELEASGGSAATIQTVATGTTGANTASALRSV